MFKVIDIYSEDNVISWSEVKASGVQWVYIEATDGISYVNPKMDSQYHGAKSASSLVIFYHFAQRNPVQIEYNHFMTTISKLLIIY
ncbi:MAG: GH25 family lysozyme [Clostridium sp.]|nr:GH25 family lysozyme [Clostridium sp.]